MKKLRALFIIALSLVLGLSLIPGSALAKTGDNPLTTSATWTGQGSVVVDVVPFSYINDPSGTFSISGIPAGSSIVSAYAYGTEWEYSLGEVASITFAGSIVGPVSPIANDPGAESGEILATYRWDVTSLVTGDGTYAFSTSGLERSFGAALVVIYSNTTKPPRQITINDGAEQLENDTSTTIFNVLSGPGTLIIFTEADNGEGASENISFNGVTILGPGDIFNANQGNFASYFELPVDVLAGTNTASIYTGADWLGWELAILSTEVTIIEVEIDIKPDSDPNSINLGDKGVLPVGILGGEDFDVYTINLIKPIRLGGTEVTVRGPAKAPKLAVSFEDVNDDGHMDLMAFFNIQSLVDNGALDETTTELMFEAETTNGMLIQGTDSVRIVPSKK